LAPSLSELKAIIYGSLTSHITSILCIKIEEVRLEIRPFILARACVCLEN
jgi:hypothetical protein